MVYVFADRLATDLNAPARAAEEDDVCPGSGDSWSGFKG
jgi:hypothetical protein